MFLQQSPSPSSSSSTVMTLTEKEEAEAEESVPKEVPTILQIKRALPPHVFRPSLGRSLYFVGKDVSLVAALYLSLLWLEGVAGEEQVLRQVLRYLVYPVYWFLQVGLA